MIGEIVAEILGAIVIGIAEAPWLKRINNRICKTFGIKPDSRRTRRVFYSLLVLLFLLLGFAVVILTVLLIYFKFKT